MRSVIELKNKKKEMEELYEHIKEIKEEIDLNAEEEMVIARIWFDVIEDLLDHNVVTYMQKNGYGDDDIDTTFSLSDENVQKEIVANEKQVYEMLEFKKQVCREHPYGRVNYWGYQGINADKVAIDVYKWVLEKDEESCIKRGKNKKSIIEEIYESKKDDYEYYIDVHYKGNKKRGMVFQLLDEMEKCYNDNIPKKSKNIIKKCYDKLDRSWSEGLDFWQKEFYKLGFLDGMRMNDDVELNSKHIND